ncbi:unnamed protein product [Arctia plantaginis]|uniref:Uncharacterized protein n=1 Tax=Arctia plantaginis TaxID=874455 RepID=A0A8S1BPK7_ARCPL|nr:unnamed protein product [Arctia plantaginis]
METDKDCISPVANRYGDPAGQLAGRLRGNGVRRRGSGAGQRRGRTPHTTRSARTSAAAPPPPPRTQLWDTLATRGTTSICMQK